MNVQTMSTSGAKAPVQPPRQQGKSVPAQAGISSQPATAPSADAQPEVRAAVAPAFIEPGLRLAMIAEAAYYRAERRGFAAGCELEDWCLAEGDIDGMLSGGEIPGASDSEDPA
jgi:DUF2934 family protein